MFDLQIVIKAIQNNPRIHQKWTKRRSESDEFGGNPMVGPAKLFMGVTMVTLYYRMINWYTDDW